MVIMSLSGFHQKVRFDCVFPIEIPLFHGKARFHSNLSRAHFEGFFSSTMLLMSCPQGPFGSWEIDFLDFSSPLFRVSCPQGPFGSWKFDFLNFSSPLFQASSPQGPFGSWKFDLFIFQAWKLCFLTDGSSQKRSGSSQKHT